MCRSKMGSENNRDIKIDLIKGFAIILVVLGHVIQANMLEYDRNVLFKIIYSFHMPLFIFLSGYVTWGKAEINLGLRWLTKKSTLLIPYMLWYIIYFYIGGMSVIQGEDVPFKEYIINGIVHPDLGLWFLWVLFLCYVFLVISLFFARYIGEASLLLIDVIIKLIPMQIMGLPLLKWYFSFFIAGYLVAKYKEELTNKKKKLLIICTIFFPVFVMFWSRDSSPIFIPFIQDYLSNIFSENIVDKILYFTIYIYRYLVAFLGIGFLFFVFNKAKVTLINCILMWIGTLTLDIYVIHFIFVKINVSSGAVGIISSTILSLVLSLLLSYFVLRRFKLLRLLLLGRFRE